MSSGPSGTRSSVAAAVIPAVGRVVHMFRVHDACLVADVVMAAEEGTTRSCTRTHRVPLLTHLAGMPPPDPARPARWRAVSVETCQHSATGPPLLVHLVVRRVVGAWILGVAWLPRDSPGATRSLRVSAVATAHFPPGAATDALVALDAPRPVEVYDPEGGSLDVYGALGTSLEFGIDGTPIAEGMTSDTVTRSSRDAAVVAGGLFETQASFLRSVFNCGVVAPHYGVRGAYDRLRRPTVGSMGIHDHPHALGICGLGEIQALVGGYFVQTRHNDYAIAFPYRHVRNGTEVVWNRRVLPPAVPPEVLALPTGFDAATGAPVANDAGTQLRWVRRLYQDAPEHAVWHLTYIEVWLEKFQGAVGDSYAGRRHSNFSDSLKVLTDAANYYARTGFCRQDENSPQVPGTVTTTRPDGTPEIAVLRYAVRSFPVATMSPRRVVRRLGVVVDDELDPATSLPRLVREHDFELEPLPIDVDASAARVLGPGNAFRLRRTHVERCRDAPRAPQAPAGYLADLPTWQQFARRAEAAWDLPGRASTATEDAFPTLQDLMRKVPGLDGYGHVPIMSWSDPTQPGTRYRPTDPRRGSGFYSNSYLVPGRDASGFTGERSKGFSNNNLMTASTTDPTVVDGVSHALPLELVLQTPRGSWNPLNVRNVASVGASVGASAADALPGSALWGTVYNLPFASFATQNPLSFQASTGRTAWVRTQGGTGPPVLMHASGTTVGGPDGFRQRYCVAPSAAAETEVGAEVDALRAELRLLLSRVAAGRTPTQDEVDSLISH